MVFTIVCAAILAVGAIAGKSAYRNLAWEQKAPACLLIPLHRTGHARATNELYRRAYAGMLSDSDARALFEDFIRFEPRLRFRDWYPRDVEVWPLIGRNWSATALPPPMPSELLIVVHAAAVKVDGRKARFSSLGSLRLHEGQETTIMDCTRVFHDWQTQMGSALLALPPLPPGSHRIEVDFDCELLFGWWPWITRLNQWQFTATGTCVVLDRSIHELTDVVEGAEACAQMKAGISLHVRQGHDSPPEPDWPGGAPPCGTTNWSDIGPLCYDLWIETSDVPGDVFAGWAVRPQRGIEFHALIGGDFGVWTVDADEVTGTEKVTHLDVRLVNEDPRAATMAWMLNRKRYFRGIVEWHDVPVHAD
jgi:hypothetical protein